MAMDKDESILVNGERKDIQIWNYNSYALKLKKTLKGHTGAIKCLCFSQKEYWFLSGSVDKSIRLWVKQQKWICQQILKDAHRDQVVEIILNNNEDQFISCSFDKNIKIWMKQKGIQWGCVQTLTEHNNFIFFLSFNSDCNLFASSGYDRLRIWQKRPDQLYNLMQEIDDPIDDIHLRIKFIDNNELIASTLKQGRLLSYTINNQVQSELQLIQIKEQDMNCFPIIYNKRFSSVIVRHSDKYTYVLRKQDNGELKIHQVLNDNYETGYLMKDGSTLILYNGRQNSLDILK